MRLKTREKSIKDFFNNKTLKTVTGHELTKQLVKDGYVSRSFDRHVKSLVDKRKKLLDRLK